MVVSNANTNYALKIFALARKLRPGLPVVMRPMDESDIDQQSDNLQPRLHAVVLPPGSRTAGRTLQELDLTRFHVDVTTVRQSNIRDSAPRPETRLGEGDAIVLGAGTKI
jgi:uncharacterized protein with PhoU and TrkA domain